ncbi:MAG: ABC transporter ATP-binding protein [Chloroflexi bacterium]|nr:ABC transporter ATP-binding protein [Chloroflexota bacterium]
MRCTGLVKRFGAITAVNGVDLTLARGQFLALLGPSGCGKTTVLRLIAGFETPDAGAIEIAGQRVAGPGFSQPPERRRVGMVFQDYALFPHLDVARNIAFGLPRGPERGRRIVESLRLVGMAGYQERMPHELSGGQQQRVALARALAPGPDVLLLDEPFSNLDAALRAQVRGEVRQILGAAGATVIMVTHDQEEALSLADQVAVMQAGRVVQVADPFELYQRPATHAVAMLVGEANVLAGEADGISVACALGRLPLARPVQGPVEVLVRPEALTLAIDPDGPASVLTTEFFGHDQLITTRLPAGLTLRARLGPRQRIYPGDRVTLHVTGDVVAFPREA